MPKKSKKNSHWSDNIIGDGITSLIQIDEATVEITMDLKSDKGFNESESKKE